MAEGSSFLTSKRRPRPLLVVAIALFHVLVLYGLMRALAPDFTEAVQDTVLETFTVTITASQEDAVDPEPDAGAAGAAGDQAVPQPRAAEPPAVRTREDPPMPRASSTGTATTSGASSGDGTGASGDGRGTGSGNAGGGQGSVASGPSVRSGELNQARDFPIPEGGRSTRFGRSVTVVFTVQTDGRATGCRVAQTSVDPETTASVCPLVMQKIRFNPALNAAGQPVPARYGYRVDFRPS